MKKTIKIITLTASVLFSLYLVVLIAIGDPIQSPEAFGASQISLAILLATFLVIVFLRKKD